MLKSFALYSLFFFSFANRLVIETPEGLEDAVSQICKDFTGNPDSDPIEQHKSIYYSVCVDNITDFQKLDDCIGYYNKEISVTFVYIHTGTRIIDHNYSHLYTIKERVFAFKNGEITISCDVKCVNYIAKKKYEFFKPEIKQVNYAKKNLEKANQEVAEFVKYNLSPSKVKSVSEAKNSFEKAYLAIQKLDEALLDFEQFDKAREEVIKALYNVNFEDYRSLSLGVIEQLHNKKDSYAKAKQIQQQAYERFKLADEKIRQLYEDYEDYDLFNQVKMEKKIFARICMMIAQLYYQKYTKDAKRIKKE
jgi:hypothetical protein